ncbi:serine/threonine-protein kinase [Streptomyces antimicrobicus]|uniref:non-specific serine/threonine protein kinase n=1 Tax=Streptomyces antimicrobicus TaxID=2883108 RepID=A0ABS8BBD3_9ACTN|nr:serine/threonine-protein kinase [Streptomyces antimicrobicus]MCB5181853.1 protein kinase [Streptomyces antimicrobicus]
MASDLVKSGSPRGGAVPTRAQKEADRASDAPETAKPDSGRTTPAAAAAPTPAAEAAKDRRGGSERAEASPAATPAAQTSAKPADRLTKTSTPADTAAGAAQSSDRPAAPATGTGSGATAEPGARLAKSPGAAASAADTAAGAAQSSDRSAVPSTGTGSGATAEPGARLAKSPAAAASAADAAAGAAPGDRPAKAATAATAGGGTGVAGVKGVTRDTGDDEGRLLARRYRLVSVLGKGGMGTVWRAQDETLGRTVAVKELRFGNGVDEDEKRRLITRTLREAKAIARIRNNGAVTVFDVVDEDARPWIVMELIEGPSLAEYIRERGPLTPRRAAEVGLAVLDVLKAAHGQGILHRDVKPSNVLIADTGRVVLTDFGIAQVEGDPSVTSTGMLVGAPSYISPERARGQRPGPPADMWSLGGLLYAAVEGVPPYDKGNALATLTAVMTEPVEPPKNAGPLTEVIYGLLVKDPARRLDDAGARAMLTAVVNAPEPDPAPSVEETRQVSLAEAKRAAEQALAQKAAERAAKKAAEQAEKAEKKERERREREQRERARAALKATRKAAAEAAAATAATATASAAEAPATATAADGGRRTAGGGVFGKRTAPVAAPLTDVMPRRTIALAIAAVVVVLAVVGGLIAYAFSGDDKAKGNGSAKGGGASAGPSGGATPGGGGGNGTGADGKGGTGGTGGASPNTASGGQNQGQGQSPEQGGNGLPLDATPPPGSGSGGTTGGGNGVPAGFTVVVNEKFHFSMAMPNGFRQTGTAGEDSGAIYSRDGGFPRIQVDFNKSPRDDARLAWAQLAPAVAGSSKDYRLLGIKPVNYRNYPTVADWEFERTQNDVRVRVLNRGFKVDATHGYAIMISCPADAWDGPECTQLRNTAFDTFQPVG